MSEFVEQGMEQGQQVRSRENPTGKVQSVSEISQGPVLDGVAWAEGFEGEGSSEIPLVFCKTGEIRQHR